MRSKSGSSNHVKCFKSGDSRELSDTRELFSLWIRQRMERPRKITILISKRAKPGWRDLGCLITWQQIFKTNLTDRNGDKRGHVAWSCSPLIWMLHQLCGYEQYHSNIFMHKTSIVAKTLLRNYDWNEAFKKWKLKLKTSTAEQCRLILLVCFVMFALKENWKNEKEIISHQDGIYTSRVFKVSWALPNKLENYF